MNFRKIFSVAFASALLFTVSCNNDDDGGFDEPKGAYENGFLISNEGNYGVPNASVTFISEDLNTVKQQIYQNENSETLGDVLQAIGFEDDRAFLVLNNSNKVTVVNRYTFKKEGEITAELNLPRYIAFANGYIYITNDQYGGEKYVSVYKESDFSFVKKITVADAAERVVEAGDKIFVQNASYGYGNKITYINPSSNEIQSEITVPNGQIQKMVEEDDKVYVIASDYGLADSYIYEISSSGAIIKTVTLTGIANAANLEIENGKYYFTSGTGVYAMAQTSTTAPSAPLFSVTDNSYSTLYGFNVEDGYIFTSDANGFTADSKITVYNESGSVLKTFDAGKGSNAFYEN